MIGVHQGDNFALLFFSLFFQAALKSLESAWAENSIPVLDCYWFPTNKNSQINSHLCQQGKAIGASFGFDESLYVNDGAFLFHQDMQLGSGKSKTEAIIFATP
eukprot:5407658-Ditylum_brightwellii.AAC.1